MFPFEFLQGTWCARWLALEACYQDAGTRAKSQYDHYLGVECNSIISYPWALEGGGGIQRYIPNALAPKNKSPGYPLVTRLCGPPVSVWYTVTKWKISVNSGLSGHRSKNQILDLLSYPTHIESTNLLKPHGVGTSVMILERLIHPSHSYCTAVNRRHAVSLAGNRGASKRDPPLHE
jgi:hypothetical protein